MIRFCSSIVVGIAIASTAHAGGSAVAGATLFNRCAICHSSTKGGPNKVGPVLFGVVGRKAGTYPGYAYSPAMQRAGFVWTPAKLMAYLAAPSQVVPGNAMPFAGIASPQQRADVVAYLGTLK